ncbi:MAG: VOC family protein [Treponema sp.]|jgi:hypothetical protein|nr:VOC family protein [Treponema sp.]
MNFPNDFVFHHIGIASLNIEKEYNNLRLFGYCKEGVSFIDEAQGIKGQFIIADRQPRIELLENLENSKTLDVWLNSNTKMYHLAYHVEDFDSIVEYLTGNRAKISSPAKRSVYFGERICFLMMANMSMIELIEMPLRIIPPPPPRLIYQLIIWIDKKTLNSL